MCTRPPRGLARLPFPLSVLLVALSCFAVPVAAQDWTPPVIRITPATDPANQVGGTYEGSINLKVEVCDNAGLNLGSVSVLLDGNPLSLAYQSWSYTPGCSGAAYASYSGAVTLPPGHSWVNATMCDNSGNCTSESMEYERTVHSILVAPLGNPQVTAGALRHQRFQVTNAGNVAESVTLGGSCSGAGVSGCTWFPTSATVEPAQSDTFVVRYTAGPEGTTGSIHYTATAAQTSGSGTATLTSVLAAGALTVDLSPHNGENVDVTAGGASLQYTTPAYISMDEPRAVRLVYSSAQARPATLLRLNAYYSGSEEYIGHPSSVDAPPDRYSLVLTNAGGVLVSETFYAGGSNTQQLSTLVDTHALTTGVYHYQVSVRAWWGNRFKGSDPAPVTLLVVNEASSPYGPGWSIAGLSRVHTQGFASGVVLTDGTGHVLLFTPPAGDPGCAAAAGCTFTSPAGDFSTLRYTAGTGYMRTHPGGGSELYTQSGILQESTDAFGNRTVYTHETGADGRIRVRTIVDPVGQVTTFAYSAGGWLSSIATPGGRTTAVYVSGGLLKTITDPDGRRALYIRYHTDGRLMYWTDRGGKDWNVEYDRAGSVQALHTPPVAIEGQGSPRLVTRVLSLPAAVLPATGAGTYSNPGPVVHSADLLTWTLSPAGDTTYTRVNRFGQPLWIKGREGVSTFTYDAHGRPLGIYTPQESEGFAYTPDRGNPFPFHQGTSILEYEPGSMRLLRSSDYAAGSGRHPAVTEYHYRGSTLALDSVVVRSVDSVTAQDVPVYRRLTTRYALELRVDGTPTGRVLSITDPAGNTTQTVYAASGMRNSQQVTDPLGRVTAVTRDVYGRVNALPGLITIQYDALNRETRRDHNGSLFVRYERSDSSGVERVITSGMTYVTVVNAVGWVVQATDPQGYSRSTGYDLRGRVVRATNRRGQSVTYQYDGRDRVTQRYQAAEGTLTTWAYGPGDKPAWVAVQNGASTDSIYMGASPGDSAVTRRPGGQRVRLLWTGEGEATVLKFRGGTSTPTFEHEQAWQSGPRWMSITVGGPTAPATTRLDYNTQGLPQQITFPSTAEQPRLTFSYTAAGEPLETLGQRWASGAPGSPAPTWRPFFRRTYGFGGPFGGFQVDSVVATSYFASNVEATRATRRYTRGREERLAGLSETLATYQTQPVCNGSYCWTSVTGSTQQSRTEAYAYDAGSSRVDTDPGAAAATTTRVASFGGFSLEYDPDGNLTRKYKAGVTDQGFTWNSLGQLTQISDLVSGRTTSFAYDGLGRRVRRTVDGVVTQYVVHNEHVALELDAAGQVLREYSYYPGGDHPHAVMVGPARTPYYYVAEHPGHVAALANGRGETVNSYEYDPWGRPTSTQQQVAQPLRWGAREYDGETGLYYVRARYYDPQLQRFISEDPIGLAGGLNPYAFAGNNPVSLRDPSGMSPWQQTGNVNPYVTGEAYCYVWEEMARAGYGVESYQVAKDKCLQYRNYCSSIGKTPGGPCNAVLGGGAVQLPTITAVGTPQSGPPLARPVQPVPAGAPAECPRDASGLCRVDYATEQEWAVFERRLNQINNAVPDCAGARGLLRWYMTPGRDKTPWIRVHDGVNYVRTAEGQLVRTGRNRLMTTSGEATEGYVVVSAYELPLVPSVVLHEVLHLYIRMYPHLSPELARPGLVEGDHTLINSLVTTCSSGGR